MSKWARVVDGEIVEVWPPVGPPPVGVDIKDAMHPDVASQFVKTDNNQVKAGWVFKNGSFQEPDVPVAPVVNRTVRKSVVMARVTAAGKIAQGYAALQANPSLFGRWFAPDRPVVNSADPDTIAFLEALGLNAQDMLAPDIE